MAGYQPPGLSTTATNQRPQSLVTIEARANGTPLPLGILTSSGTTAPVNNLTTANKFFAGGGANADGSSLDGSLAGKMVMLQAISSGLILVCASSVFGGSQLTVAPQSVIPPLAGASPGFLLTTGSSINFMMLPTHGWIQWLSASGPASCLVWELV